MKPVETKREVSQRWTPGLVRGGWTPISNFFIENYHRLDPPLSHAEVLFIIHLIFHKWDEHTPFPSLVKIAQRMSITATALRNHVRKLEKKGYLRREYRTATTNMFHLNGLFKRLENLLISNLTGDIVCPRCNKRTEPARFCKHCGAKLGSEGSESERSEDQNPAMVSTA